MKIAVLGGAFNPPHLGHILIARQVLQFTAYQAVWLTPCWQHNFEKPLAAAKHRSQMTKMLEEKNIQYCHEEISHQLSGDTIKLMTLFKKTYRQHDFAFVIGTDNLQSFSQWGHWQKLVTTFPFLVFPRPGSTYDLPVYGLNIRKNLFQQITNPLLITSNISSTLLRQRIHSGLNNTNLTKKAILDYIKKNKLYKD